MTFRALVNLWGVSAVPANATELVYQPVNPHFGGNPLAGNFLLNSAQAQNDYDDPDSRDLANSRSDLSYFSDLLERSILSRIASNMSSELFGPDGELVPGSLETENFAIEIIDLGNGVLEIITTDKTTGDTTSFQMSSGL